jgi:hypothetical protein
MHSAQECRSRLLTRDRFPPASQPQSHRHKDTDTDTQAQTQTQTPIFFELIFFMFYILHCEDFFMYFLIFFSTDTVDIGREGGRGVSRPHQRHPQVRHTHAVCVCVCVCVYVCVCSMWTHIRPPQRHRHARPRTLHPYYYIHMYIYV